MPFLQKNIYKCDIYLFHDIALSSFVRFAYLLQYLWTIRTTRNKESPHSLASILDLFLHFPSKRSYLGKPLGATWVNWLFMTGCDGCPNP